ncbi:MAG: DUF3899 domain-containing protein [Vulcanibacillus sp.]
MRRRIWTIRFISIFTSTIISLLISFVLKSSYTINYINTTFIIGLIFIVFSSLSFVIIFGFFTVLLKGFKLFFYRENPSVDRTHWSYDINNTPNNNHKNLLREKARKELFIYLPFIIGVVMILQSIIILTLTK